MPRRTRPRASDQLPRQWTLLRLLLGAEAPGVTVRELADQLRAPKSNIERDLHALERAGFRLVQAQDPEHSQRVRWRAEVDRGLMTQPGFGPAELLSLYAAATVLHFMEGTPVAMDLQAVLQKVRASMAQNQRRTTVQLSHVFAPHRRDYVNYDGEDARRVLDDLMDAVARQRKCRITYQSAERARGKTYVVHPLRIFGHHSALYVLGVVEPSRQVRTFAVHRLQDIDVLKAGFRPPKLDLEALAERAFGVFQEEPQDIEVVFAPDTARYVMERTYHPREAKELLPDGSVRYRVRAGGRMEVVAWVLGFGGSARLVKPDAWTEDVRVKARLALAAHGE